MTLDMSKPAGRMASTGPATNPDLSTASRDRHSPSSLVGRFVHALRQRGIMAALRQARAFVLLRLHARLVDSRHAASEAVATACVIDITPQMIARGNAEHAIHYSPTPRKVVDWLIDCMPGDRAQQTFIDYGSGRGRVVMAAAGKPFKRVIGVELFADLHADSLTNLAALKAGSPAAGDISCVCEDATCFDIPPGCCILYFFKPFTAPVFDRVLARAAVARSTRDEEIYCIFYNVDDGDDLACRHGLERLRAPLAPAVKLALASPYRFALYRILPERQTGQRCRPQRADEQPHQAA